MTTIRLNDDLNNKLLTLKTLEHTTKTEIIKRAIYEYYVHHVKDKTPYELGEDIFGKFGDDKNLSTKITNIINK